MNRRHSRLLIVLAGIILGQVILYGPSLVGRKILLPLDVLAEPNVYLPRTPEVAKIKPQDPYFSDLVYLMEPARRFAVSEIQAGRFPMWLPYQHAGVPLVWLKLSPFLFLEYCIASPVILAWMQLVTAIIAGVGAYSFCRRGLGVGFWPAAIVAWCYPLTGFFIFWQGFPLSGVVSWFPWLLLAVDRTVRKPQGAAPIVLGTVTGLALTSGQLDIAGQSLLISGVYALWCFWDTYPQKWLQRSARKAVLLLAVGWGLGILLAAPHVLPLLEYTAQGSRMARRGAGMEERPPAGLATLPLVVLPDYFGSTQRDSLPNIPGSQTFLESAAVAYAGVVATLFVAPLAWSDRRHRRAVIFWSGLAVFGLSWCLNLPGFVDLLRLPGLNMMSHNRLVFATSFAILVLAALGLEGLAVGRVTWQRWFWVPAVLLAGLSMWCVYRAVKLPEPMSTQLEMALRQGENGRAIPDLAAVRTIQTWFVRHYLQAALLCGAGFAGWMFLFFRRVPQAWLMSGVGLVLVGDLLWFASGRNPQCDPALYYPPLPVLAEIAQVKPDRIMGYSCLPASLSAMAGLWDLRGCDGVDPARLMDLMKLAEDPLSTHFPYAQTQWIAPQIAFTREMVLHLSPILDLLGVRFVIFRGTPSPGVRPAFQATDYWALENPSVLPRAFVPQRVELEADEVVRLQQMAAPDFNPRAVAYVESPVSLPTECRGTAAIVEEIPTHIKIAINMETPGLVMLADLWDQGWHATLNGQPVPILRTDHALRGVVVPAGAGMLEFRYAPASFAWGLRLAGLAAAVLLMWSGIIFYGSKTRTR